MFLAAPALLVLSHPNGICSVPRSLEENKGLHTPRHSTPPTAEEACCHQWVFAVEGDLENHGEERTLQTLWLHRHKLEPWLSHVGPALNPSEAQAFPLGILYNYHCSGPQGHTGRPVLGKYPAFWLDRH